jgi:hydrogenase small subunit
MENLDRRSFLKLSARLGALMGLGLGATGRITEALAEIASGKASLLWLQGQSCSGCSISLLDSASLTPVALLTQYVNLAFHQTLSTATGQVAVNVVNKTIDQGGYILVVEGAVPGKMSKACVIGDETFGDQLVRAAGKAKAVVTAGTCASFGGIPAAENNPTGACSAAQYLSDKAVKTPLLRVPGCPAHPDWLLGTLVHVLKFGIPEVDHLGRPKTYFKSLLHERCPRFFDYERERFATAFGEEGCLFRLGCQGPLTQADCTTRNWNGVNSCIHAGAPCIGCASPDFAKKANYQFYTPEMAAEGKQKA